MPAAIVISFESGRGERGRSSGWSVVCGMGGLGARSSSPSFPEPRRRGAGGEVSVDSPEGTLVSSVSWPVACDVLLDGIVSG